MSVRNQRTGRHEDDFLARLHTGRGVVSLEEILEHLEETVVGCGFGSNVETPLRALTQAAREMAGDLELDTNRAQFNVGEGRFVRD